MQKQDVITISADNLPKELHRLHKVPKELHLLGNTDLLMKKPRVGIVGARKYTSYGRDVTSSIAGTLSKAGVCIVSGLALGIDSIAHKSCLENGGNTIAVLPSGLNTIYPASHRQLAQQIINQKGLLISEYPDGFRPHKVTFLERNRIIAALSDVLIVTEAAIASGTLNTASHALEIGVPIMAVPGNINSPLSAGTNNLIKAGAMPLTNPDDVFALLGMNPEEKKEYIPESGAEDALITALKAGASSTDELIAASKLEFSTAQTTLTMLEIKGVVSVSAGAWQLL